MLYLSLLYLSDLESLSDRRSKLSKLFLTKFVMMTDACMTSYRQNVTYDMIDCGTLQHILPHSAEQSVINEGIYR